MTNKLHVATPPGGVAHPVWSRCCISRGKNQRQELFKAQNPVHHKGDAGNKLDQVVRRLSLELRGQASGPPFVNYRVNLLVHSIV